MFVVDLPRDKLTSGWCHWLNPGWHNHNHQKTRVSPSTGNGIIATALTFLSMRMENSRANKRTSRTQMIFYNPPVWEEPRWCTSLAFVLQMYSAPKHTSRSTSGWLKKNKVETESCWDDLEKAILVKKILQLITTILQTRGSRLSTELRLLPSPLLEPGAAHLLTGAVWVWIIPP